MTIRVTWKMKFLLQRTSLGTTPLDSFNRWCLKTVPGELSWPEQRFGGLPSLFDKLYGTCSHRYFYQINVSITL